MDSSSPEYTIVHRALDPQPDYNLMLLKKDDRYRALYRCAIRENLHIRRWWTIDELAWWGIRWISLAPFDTFVEMGEFIRDYVGEARCTLAALEQA